MKLRINYLTLTLSLAAMTLMFSCKEEKKEPKMEAPEAAAPPVEEVTIVETDVYVIDEHHFNDMPLTSYGKKVKATEVTETETEEYDVRTPEEIHVDLVEVEYEPVEVALTAAAVPVDETQTIVSYNKKGKQTGMLQIVKDADGNIDKIAFADKHHKDKYDVKAGMSAKEVRRLRRRLKHVVRKSDHYLVDDQSNIMYLLNVADNLGNEITDAQIDKSEVRTIIWEDKNKRKKHNKHKS